MGVIAGERQNSTIAALGDDAILYFGAGNDNAFVHRSSVLNANTALTGVVIGTPVVTAMPADTLIMSNVTASGDIVWLLNDGSGNSWEYLRFDGSADLIVFNEAGSDIDFRVETDSQTHALFIEGSTGHIFINETDGAGGTGPGITMNIGSGLNAVFIKQANVAHGMTTVVETDTFGLIATVAGDTGGLNLVGLTDAGAGGTTALAIKGIAGQAGDGTHTTAGRGIVEAWAYIKNGTGVADPAADANLFAIRIGGTNAAKFIVDTEGNYFSDDTGSTYDDWDDIALVHAFDLRKEFGEWRGANQASLVRAGILAPDDEHGNRGFVNWTNLLRLHNGALRQTHSRIATLEKAQERIAELESRLLALEGAH